MSGGILSLPRPGLRFACASARKKNDFARPSSGAAQNFDADRRQA